MSEPLPNEVLFNTREAALYLRISHHSLLKWRVNNEGPRFVRIGSRAVRYKVSDLNTFLSENTTTQSKEQQP